MKVWLDDFRETPAGWVHAFTPEEVIGLLSTGKVTEVSLDHDLGLGAAEGERTGYDVLLWLEGEVGNGRWTAPLPGITIHTRNPVGRARMVRVLRTIRRLHAMEYERGRS